MPCTISTTKLTIASVTRVLTSLSSPGGHELPVRPPEECADDDQNHIDDHKGQEKRIGQQAFAREPPPHSGDLAIQVRHQQQQYYLDGRNADPAPERRVTHLLLQSEEVPWRLRWVRRVHDVDRLFQRRVEVE